MPLPLPIPVSVDSIVQRRKWKSQIAVASAGKLPVVTQRNNIRRIFGEYVEIYRFDLSCFFIEIRQKHMQI